MGAASKGNKFSALKKKWKNLSKDDIIKEYVEKWPHIPNSL